MQANKARNTGPEVALRCELHSRGLRFFIHRRPIKDVRRTCDILFPTARLAVFVDGCFWHGCPEHYVASKTNSMYWDQKIEANRVRDSETDRLLSSAGWHVLRIWEHTSAKNGAQMVEDCLHLRCID